MTPLKANLSLVLNGYKRGDYPEGETLVIVMTDGEPSDTNFNSMKSQVRGGRWQGERRGEGW